MNRTLFLFSALLFSINAFAQHSAHTHSTGINSTAHKDSILQPSEPGQDAFAAIQEVVMLLEANTSTDWSKVNITALQQHLIDMHNVTLNAKVINEAIENGVRYTVTGSAAVADSIRRMVMGHAKTMSGNGGWHFVAKERPDGVTLAVTVDNKDQLTKLRALGFIGIMTRGMHHQSHHLMIAKGEGPHE